MGKMFPLAVCPRVKGDVHLKELFSGGVTFLLLRVVGAASGYVFALLVTRNLGAGAMGSFALATTVLSVFTVVGKLGLDTALLRFVAEHSSQGRWDMAKGIFAKAVKITIPFCLMISALLFAAAPAVAEGVFRDRGLSTHLRLVSVAVVPAVLVSINSAALRGVKKIREFSFFQNASGYLFASVFLALFLTSGREPSFPAVSYVLSLFVGCGLSLLLWLRSAAPGALAAKASGRELLGVSLPMLLSGSMGLVMQWAATIILGMFRTAAEVGLYSVASKVAAFSAVTLVAVTSMAAPKFAELHGRGDSEGLQRIVRQSTKLIFWSSFPILLFTVVFPSQILGLFGREFKGGAGAVVLLALGQFINAASGSVGMLLHMTGRQKAFQNIMLSAAFVNVCLNLLLIPRYGITGAAVAATAGMVFWNLVSVAYVKASMNVSTIYVPGLRSRRPG